ncbi:GGDEF domain-containing protein [Aliiglaciecola sp. 3_MG-2023]|uniref:GGDEF domain-containing protein n=1 Tax=Aliiglaciecola sp. 3_MG-2023 TaxID=3062644 RepID=UPI0026E3D027|nr:GGDEF domain-containing protein [Aliiglaciecola sp. 3_MG-2023]MDO6694066.1 GGDEF domain-containing protein [Aliiglaciecola sp. 3_MG-2023]
MTPVFDAGLKDNNLFSSGMHNSGLSHTESHQIMLQLSTSIDLEEIAQLFYRQLKAKINLQGLSIKFPDGLLTFGNTEKSKNNKTLDQVSQHKIFATLIYSFSNVLSLRETAILTDLHRLFKFPLKNALEFHSVKQLALKDHLTSLGNRVHYQESLLRLLSHAKRASESFGLLVIDLDKFKLVNDTFGHQEGDQVLIAVANVLNQSLRNSDYAFRFGGDEFCCLLPGSDELTNSKIAKRIQGFMNRNTVLAKYNISCSIGSTMYQFGDTDETLFNRADKALYAAKLNGKNCYKAA